MGLIIHTCHILRGCPAEYTISHLKSAQRGARHITDRHSLNILPLGCLSASSSVLVMTMPILQDLQGQMRSPINHTAAYNVRCHYYYSKRNTLSDPGRDQRYWLGYLSTPLAKAQWLPPEASEGDITWQHQGVTGGKRGSFGASTSGQTCIWVLFYSEHIYIYMFTWWVLKSQRSGHHLTII